jgi:hypothetical protein
MREYVKNKVKGEPLLSLILQKIAKVEDAFLSGTLPSSEAKDALRRLP